MNNIFKLVISIVMCLSAGFIGSFFTMKNIPTWYASLNKPTFNPPDWLFGPVWTFLYILMGISFFLIWKTESDGKTFAVAFFIVQLIMNSLWSFLFFGMKNPSFAFIEIIVLWVFILICIITFNKISPLASYLLIPYLLWVSFASVLNYSIVKLN